MFGGPRSLSVLSVVTMLGFVVAGCSIGVRNGTKFEVVTGDPSDAVSLAEGISYQRDSDGRLSIQAFDLMATNRVDRLRYQDVAYHLPSTYDQSIFLGVFSDLFIDLFIPVYFYPNLFEIVPVSAEADRAPGVFTYTIRWHIVGCLLAILPGITMLPGDGSIDAGAVADDLVYERAPEKTLEYSSITGTTRKPIANEEKALDVRSSNGALSEAQWRALLESGTCLVALRRGARLSGIIPVRLEDVIAAFAGAVEE